MGCKCEGVAVRDGLLVELSLRTLSASIRGWPPSTHTAVLCEVDLARLCIVVESQGCHSVEDILAVDRLSLVIEDLFRRFRALRGVRSVVAGRRRPTPTRNEMNSDTHSCTHSLASLAIFALSGNAAFIILPTFAIYRRVISRAPQCKGVNSQADTDPAPCTRQSAHP